MRIFAFVVVALLAGCIPQVPTPAAVIRISRPSGAPATLVACQVILGWTEEDLRGNCSTPDATVGWVGHADSTCLVYRTSAKSFAQGSGVEVIVACLGKPQILSNSTARPRRYVESVFGLASDALEQIHAAPQ